MPIWLRAHEGGRLAELQSLLGRGGCEEMHSPSVEHAPNGASTNSDTWRGSVSTREWRIRSGTLCGAC
jgi:hypothetical protein